MRPTKLVMMPITISVLFSDRSTNCSRTLSEAGAWWVVDIGGPHRVQKVSIDNSYSQGRQMLTLYGFKMKN